MIEDLVTLRTLRRVGMYAKTDSPALTIDVSIKLGFDNLPIGKETILVPVSILRIWCNKIY